MLEEHDSSPIPTTRKRGHDTMVSSEIASDAIGARTEPGRILPSPIYPSNGFWKRGSPIVQPTSNQTTLREQLDEDPSLDNRNDRQPNSKPHPYRKSRHPKIRMNVIKACGPCRNAHLACDNVRPCTRCKGKKETCHDVPHKKRGRPRVQDGFIHKPRLCHPTNAPDVMEEQQSLPFHDTSANPDCGWADTPGEPSTPVKPECISSRDDVDPKEVSETDEIFELITTVDFRVIRATKNMYPLVHYRPDHMIGREVYDLIHPDDIFFIESERQNLLDLFPAYGEVCTSVEAARLISALSFDTVYRPIWGMPPFYPNRNIRFKDGVEGYTWFNLRLHLGGGLGGSLDGNGGWGRDYFCLSFLRLDRLDVDHSLPETVPEACHTASRSSIRKSQSVSTTISPISPLTPLASAPMDPPALTYNERLTLNLSQGNAESPLDPDSLSSSRFLPTAFRYPGPALGRRSFSPPLLKYERPTTFKGDYNVSDTHPTRSLSNSFLFPRVGHPPVWSNLTMEIKDLYAGAYQRGLYSYQ